MPDLTYEPFTPAHPLERYFGLSGHEANGLALTAEALRALAETRSSGVPCEYAVIGQWHRALDGAFYLDFATTAAWIEARTNYRHDHKSRRLRWTCPECGKAGGHEKDCERR